MAWPVRLCLTLQALTWAVQAQECPGPSSDMVSRIKFKWYPNSQTFAEPGNGEINVLDNVPSLQDCANHCAVIANCKASVWNDITHHCRLISDTDGCQDEEPSQHSLWRVGFIDDAGTIGCSEKEIEAKCADKETAARLEAEKECNSRNDDLRAEIARLQAENTALRAAKNEAERKLGDAQTTRDEDQKRLNKQCQDKLNDEIEKRRKAVKDARDDAERNCRSKQENEHQRQLDDLRAQCDEKSKADKAERDRIESQCADSHDKLTQRCIDDLSKADQKYTDCNNKCNEDIRRKDEQIQQCTDILNIVKDQQKQSDNQCQADKANLQKDCDNIRNNDKIILEATCQAEKDIINKKCTYDTDAAKRQLEQQLESRCRAEKDLINKQCTNDIDSAKRQQEQQLESKCRAEKDVINERCSSDIDAAKRQLGQQLESKCRAEKDNIKKQCTYDIDAAKRQLQQQLDSKCQAEKDVINNQCTYDIDAAKRQQQQQLDSKCQREKDELDKQCNDRLAKEQKTSDEACQRQKDDLDNRCNDKLANEQKTADDTCQRQKDDLQKECDDRCKTQARGKDDICYNPGGFGAWPDTIPPFDIDDTNYVLKPNTNLRPGPPIERTATSPAACAREYCNDVSDCVAIRWDVNKLNTCYVFNESPYSPFEKSRLRDYSNSYMIVKSDRMR
ncbi:hypothetical protein HYE68_001091 [Fusarium pseudograminearum]|nr:hypothetical protein HYE68_001091 [Fusarium pseudograminearum]